MHIVYNGIELEMLEIDEFVQEAVYDDTKTDWLYDRVFISGKFVVNGQQEVNAVTPVTSYVENPDLVETLRDVWRRTAPVGARPTLPVGGEPRGVNVAAFGRIGTDAGGPYPAVPSHGVYATSTGQERVTVVAKQVVPAVNTAAVIRKRLLNPRGRLFVFTGSGDPTRADEMLLMVPSAWGSHTDVKNGPQPQYCRVQTFHGDARTFVVEWAIEAFIRETYSEITDEGATNTRATDPLLSNRFKCRHVMDEDFYLAIETEGTALFRTDTLYQRNPLNPDQYRLSVCLPIPFGMVREGLVIDPIPDGTGFHYAFTDRQQHANFVGGPFANATHIDAVHRQAIAVDEDALTGALHAYERVYNLRANRRASRDDGTSPLVPLPPPPPPLPPRIRGPRP